MEKPLVVSALSRPLDLGMLYNSRNDQIIPVACKLTLDPNTASKRLLLSEGNRKMTWVFEKQPYPDHPDRFTQPQVLSREPLTGRCYWECEWYGTQVDMGVAYQSIGRDTWLNPNVKSWVLEVDDNRYSVYHDTFSSVLPSPPSGSRRAGVFLDHEAGTLSFYSVHADTLTHLHTFKDITFTDEPLYAAFYVYPRTPVALC